MKHARPISLSVLMSLFGFLLILPVACSPARGGGGGGGDPTDDDDDRDPEHSTSDSDSGSTQGSGAGKNTGSAAVGNTDSYGEGTSTLYVVNTSGLTVTEIYVTPCSASSWGPNWLGQDPLWDDWYYFLTGLDSGCYDIEAWDEDTEVWWDRFGADIDGEYTLVLLPPVGGDDDDDVVDDDDDMSDCAEDEVVDCYGGCTPASWIGDGDCDEDLDCAEFGYDAGDCDVGDDDDAGTCGGDEMEDCDGNCAPIEWLGDTYCDDYNYEWPEGSGILINYNCAEFDYDGGDCAGK